MLKEKVWRRKKSTTYKCDLTLCAQNKENKWFVDSVFSKHMTGDQNKFISLNKKDRNVSF